MDNKALIEGLRKLVNSMKSALNDTKQLKDDTQFFIRNSEEKLIAALRQEPKNSDEITKIREKLENDLRVYANCELLIIKYQADILTNEMKIRSLERDIETINNKIFLYRNNKKDDPDNGKNKVAITVYPYSQTAHLFVMR